ncbi:hypothetical protein [Paenibacillus sacheonensis]|uniref:Uncharacterized protein n=1 Tax=Paenibacillus sacheonensis TaxID=742054 RepID=A0A7X4YKK9_9BACL|nr:hypothetical protein [Paenibacillus sacheonensis]MBM7563337.1 hypothetical protein [Paenibacillus sacheonensis]NBC68107.1 hypothetical protein [Paenibacillus sacheonensis]
MIQYGSDTITQLTFVSFRPRMERRDNQWIDIELAIEVNETTPVPMELTDLTVLVICTHGGAIAQIVPLDEGTDCEFQFTSDEKEQIRTYIESETMQAAIANLAAQ